MIRSAKRGFIGTCLGDTILQINCAILMGNSTINFRVLTLHLYPNHGEGVRRHRQGDGFPLNINRNGLLDRAYGGGILEGIDGTQLIVFE